MPLRPLDRAMAVRFAALAVLCPERTLTEVADARNLPQQLATLFDEAVVIGPGHVRLHLSPNIRNRYRGETMAFLNLAKSGRAPPCGDRLAVAHPDLLWWKVSGQANGAQPA